MSSFLLVQEMKGTPTLHGDSVASPVSFITVLDYDFAESSLWLDVPVITVLKLPLTFLPLREMKGT